MPNHAHPVVWLIDFEGRGDISAGEFEDFLNVLSEGLHSHDVTSPGIISGRKAYDTPFYNGGDRDNPGAWPADQQACIENIGCYGRSDINYVAQGMWSAAAGESLETAKAISGGWKLRYGHLPSEDVLFWIEYGHSYYTEKYAEE